jgi:hypothetical protein
MHFQDDQFHPAHDDGFDNDSYYNEDIDTVDAEYDNATYTSVETKHKTPKKNHRDNQLAFKMLDKGFKQIYRNTGGKKTPVDVYVTSCKPGLYIRDAITGAKYRELLVGSSDEDNFFKVKWTASRDLGTESVNMYFESPTQCERHLKITISDKTKCAWYEKYADYELKMRKASAANQ